MKCTSNKYNRLFNTLLFSGLGCFSYLFLVTYADIPASNQHILTTPKAVLSVIVVFNILGMSIMYINTRIHNAYPTFLKDRKKLILYSVAIALLLFALNYLLLTSIKWITNLPDPFKVYWSGLRKLLSIWLVELILVSQIMINSFYRQLIILLKRNSELEESSAQAQYQALQNQLNPHFLFNSLNTLISEIEYNPKNAALFTRHLSDVYRYILQCEDQQLVTLESEIDFLNSYIFLHQVRLGNCIHIHNNIDPACYNLKVPPLTLQMLTENVIKHNVISATKPMTIELKLSAKSSWFEMKNEIRSKKDVIPSGKGLKNLSARYKLLCDKDIVIENDAHYFTVKAPLLNE